MAKDTLRNIQYKQKYKGRTYFNDNLDFEGWNFIYDKLFELPRNDELISIII